MIACGGSALASGPSAKLGSRAARAESRGPRVGSPLLTRNVVSPAPAHAQTARTARAADLPGLCAWHAVWAALCAGLALAFSLTGAPLQGLDSLALLVMVIPGLGGLALLLRDGPGQRAMLIGLWIVASTASLAVSGGVNGSYAAFAFAPLAAGLAGSLYAFSKGSIAPDVLAVSRSVDGLVMVLLGGLQTLAGPLVGAAAYTWLQDAAARSTEYWHAVLGLAILALVMLFPAGLAGAAARLQRRRS